MIIITLAHLIPVALPGGLLFSVLDPAVVVVVLNNTAGVRRCVSLLLAAERRRRRQYNAGSAAGGSRTIRCWLRQAHIEPAAYFGAACGGLLSEQRCVWEKTMTQISTVASIVIHAAVAASCWL